MSAQHVTEFDNIERIGKKQEVLEKPIYIYDLETRKKLISRLLDGYDKRERLLDLGCSNGFYYDLFRDERFKELHGVDISYERASVAHSRGYDSVTICRGQNIPMPDNYFDVVINQEVLVHVLREEDRQAMINEAFRLLKPGGMYILSFPSLNALKAINTANKITLVEYLKAAKDRLNGSGEKNNPAEYCRYWTGQRMEDMLREAGFTIRNKLGHMYLYPEALHVFPPLLNVLDSALRSRIPYLGKITYVSSIK